MENPRGQEGERTTRPRITPPPSAVMLDHPPPDVLCVSCIHSSVCALSYIDVICFWSVFPDHEAQPLPFFASVLLFGPPVRKIVGVGEDSVSFLLIALATTVEPFWSIASRFQLLLLFLRCMRYHLTEIAKRAVERITQSLYSPKAHATRGAIYECGDGLKREMYSGFLGE